jgi:Mitochondrial carrier protein
MVAEPKPSFLHSLVVCRTPWLDVGEFTLVQAGGLAGTAVDLLFFPLDTIKTRLQSAQGFSRAGGFNGVYKGVGSVVVGSAPGGKAFTASFLSS